MAKARRPATRKSWPPRPGGTSRGEETAANAAAHLLTLLTPPTAYDEVMCRRTFGSTQEGGVEMEACGFDSGET